MTFLQWLRPQRTRDDPVGDLARDVLADREQPTGHVTKEQWRRYLQTRGACEGAFTALDRAWRAYQRACVPAGPPSGGTD